MMGERVFVFPKKRRGKNGLPNNFIHSRERIPRVPGDALYKCPILLDCTYYRGVTLLRIFPHGFSDCVIFSPTSAYALSSNRSWNRCPQCNPQDNARPF